MPNRKEKGSKFEREICKQISLWWTDGERDDVFWRSATSGAMAKTRSKKGKKTFGQYGDIQATDPIGQPLIDLCVIELKRGYKKASVVDVLDKMKTSVIQPWEQWVFQVMEDCDNAKVLNWMLITKRDKRKPIIFMPNRLLQLYLLWGNDLKSAQPYVKIKPLQIKKQENIGLIYGTTLEQFFKYVCPDSIVANNIKESEWKPKRKSRPKRKNS